MKKMLFTILFSMVALFATAQQNLPVNDLYLKSRILDFNGDTIISPWASGFYFSNKFRTTSTGFELTWNASGRIIRVEESNSTGGLLNIKAGNSLSTDGGLLKLEGGDGAVMAANGGDVAIYGGGGIVSGDVYLAMTQASIPIGNAYVKTQTALSSNLTVANTKYVDDAVAAGGAAGFIDYNTWYKSLDQNGDTINLFKYQYDKFMLGAPLAISSFDIEPDAGMITLASQGTVGESSYGDTLGFQVDIGGQMGWRAYRVSDGVGFTEDKAVFAVDSLVVDGTGLDLSSYVSLSDNAVWTGTHNFEGSSFTVKNDILLNADGNDREITLSGTLGEDLTVQAADNGFSLTAGSLYLAGGFSAGGTNGDVYLAHDGGGYLGNAYVQTQSPLTSNTTVANTKYVDDAITAAGTGGTGTSSTTEILYNNAGTVDGTSGWKTNGTTQINASDNSLLNFGTTTKSSIRYNSSDAETQMELTSGDFSIENSTGYEVAHFEQDNTQTNSVTFRYNSLLKFNVRSTGTLTTGIVDATQGFADNGTAGVDGTFSAGTKDVTVSGGIITSIIIPEPSIPAPAPSEARIGITEKNYEKYGLYVLGVVVLFLLYRNRKNEKRIAAIEEDLRTHKSRCL